MSFRSLLLLLVLLVPAGLYCQDHVVSPADLDKEIRSAAEARRTNQAKVEKLFSAEPVKKALDAAKLDRARVEKAIPLLTDEELARLASQAEKVQIQIAAGALNNQEITYIIIALATAVIILVIVAAR